MNSICSWAHRHLKTWVTLNDFVRGVTPAGVDPEKRYIVQFPEENDLGYPTLLTAETFWLGKKCFALRIASGQEQKAGWLSIC